METKLFKNQTIIAVVNAKTPASKMDIINRVSPHDRLESTLIESYGQDALETVLEQLDINMYVVNVTTEMEDELMRCIKLWSIKDVNALLHSLPRLKLVELRDLPLLIQNETNHELRRVGSKVIYNDARHPYAKYFKAFVWPNEIKKTGKFIAESLVKYESETGGEITFQHHIVSRNSAKKDHYNKIYFSASDCQLHLFTSRVGDKYISALRDMVPAYCNVELDYRNSVDNHWKLSDVYDAGLIEDVGQTMTSLIRQIAEKSNVNALEKVIEDGEVGKNIAQAILQRFGKVVFDNIGLYSKHSNGIETMSLETLLNMNEHEVYNCFNLNQIGQNIDHVMYDSMAKMHEGK